MSNERETLNHGWFRLQLVLAVGTTIFHTCAPNGLQHIQASTTTSTSFRRVISQFHPVWGLRLLLNTPSLFTPYWIPLRKSKSKKFRLQCEEACCLFKKLMEDHPCKKDVIARHTISSDPLSKDRFISYTPCIPALASFDHLWYCTLWWSDCHGIIHKLWTFWGVVRFLIRPSLSEISPRRFIYIRDCRLWNENCVACRHYHGNQRRWTIANVRMKVYVFAL